VAAQIDIPGRRRRIDPALLDWPLEFLHDVQLVGVINTSPDSYFSDSTVPDVDTAVSVARRHIKEGAHILEVGGLSGGSAAKRISTEEEIKRTIPAIEAIAAEFPQATVTVDTFRSEVAAKAIEVGATWINDVTALTFDPEMVKLAYDHGATVVIMHLEGPGGAKGRKLNRPFYSDVVAEVKTFLRDRVNALVDAGLTHDQIIVDVGLGAGKRPAHDYVLLANLTEFNDLGCKQMGACSRKQLVEAISPVPPDERLGGSIVAALWSVLSGCHYLRVHEVRPYAQAIDVWNGIMAQVNKTRADLTVEGIAPRIDAHA
jgi:dihydropteroate synthase